MGAGLAPKVEQVLEALRRDERRAGAFAFEQCVRGDRRAVREALDGGRADLCSAASTDSSCDAAVGTFAVRTRRRRAAPHP